MFKSQNINFKIQWSPSYRILSNLRKTGLISEKSYNRIIFVPKYYCLYNLRSLIIESLIRGRPQIVQTVIYWNKYDPVIRLFTYKTCFSQIWQDLIRGRPLYFEVFILTLELKRRNGYTCVRGYWHIITANHLVRWG